MPAAPTAPSVAVAADEPIKPEAARSDPMDTLRDISVRFFKLTLSQKSAIAGKLNLLEEEDADESECFCSWLAFLLVSDILKSKLEPWSSSPWIEALGVSKASMEWLLFFSSLASCLFRSIVSYIAI